MRTDAKTKLEKAITAAVLDMAVAQVICEAENKCVSANQAAELVEHAHAIRDGTPGWRPPVEELEEAEMGDTVTVADVAVNAPCARCVHEPVCGIRATIKAIADRGIDLEMPKPDPALTVRVALDVDCSHFLAVKSKRLQSPAARAASVAAAANMREVRMAKRAARDEAVA